MSILIYITIFSILFTFFAYKHEKYAFLLMVFLLPTYQIRFQVLGLPATMLESMILINFVIWFYKNWKVVFSNIKNRYNSQISNLKSQIPVIRYPFDTEIILLLLISTLAVMIAGFNNSALGIWKSYFFEPILVYLLFINIFAKNNEKEDSNYSRDLIIYALAGSAFYISIFAIYQKLTGNFIFNEFWANEPTRRVTGVFSYPNALGLYLGPIVLIIFGKIVSLFKSFKGKSNYTINLNSIFLITVLITSVLAIYFAKSEGALIGIIFGVWVFMLFINKIFCRTAIGLAIIGVVIFTGMNYLVYRSASLARGEIESCICENMPKTVDVSRKVIAKVTLSDLSGEIRKQQWRETWQMMTESSVRFLLGTGLSNYQKSVAPYHQEGIFYNFEDDPDFRRKIVIFDNNYRAKHWQPVEVYMYPHNILLNFWTELGIAGMLLFIWIIIKYIYSGIKMIENLANKYIIIGLISAMVMIIVHGLVDVPYFKNDLSVMFWIMFGMMGVYGLRNKKKCS